MTSSAGLPTTPPQKASWSRGKKELVAALVAMPVLLAAGVYIGSRISDPGSTTLEPAAGIASPVVTVVASPPAPIVTVKPSEPVPVVTVRPPAPSPLVTVKPPTAPVAAPPTVAGPVSGPVAPAQPPAEPQVVLGRGSSGAEVCAWQQQMARRTWRIRVDGIFGRESERVARRFQRNKGLRVDGWVGQQTWDAAWQLPVIR